MRFQQHHHPSPASLGECGAALLAPGTPLIPGLPSPAVRSGTEAENTDSDLLFEIFIYLGLKSDSLGKPRSGLSLLLAGFSVDLVFVWLVTRVPLCPLFYPWSPLS